MAHSSVPVVAAAVTAADLARAGLLETGPGCVISPHAAFIPADMLGTVRPIVLGERCTVGAFAVLHGGARLAADVRVEEHVIVGQPEYGYAVRNIYPGAGKATVIGEQVILRSGAIIYAGVTIGFATTIGHHTLLRTGVSVGDDSQLGHNLTIERGTRIGAGVRMSPGTHLTAATEVADRVFLGAGVRTINDKLLIWRDHGHETELTPPRFGEGCKVGSGAVILADITVGAHALVGAGSVVTHDVAPGAVIYGVPARVPAAAGAQ
jgi:acetyltransferase-like isoleucine patch superfamily enzyme